MSKSRNIEVSAESTAYTLSEETTDTYVSEVSEEAVPSVEQTSEAGVSDAKGNPAMLVYIGPTIFRTALISGRVFITHGTPIDDILTDELREYPLARRMFVPPEEAAEAMKKIHDTGTALGNAYKRLSGN